MSFSKLDGTYNRSNGITKRCPKCGLTKVLDEYYRNRKTGKLYSWCKKCENGKYSSRKSKEYKRKYYLKNKERYKERNKKWLQKNRIKWRNYMRAYRSRDKEEF